MTLVVLCVIAAIIFAALGKPQAALLLLALAVLCIVLNLGHIAVR